MAADDMAAACHRSPGSLLYRLPGDCDSAMRAPGHIGGHRSKHEPRYAALIARADNDVINLFLIGIFQKLTFLLLKGSFGTVNAYHIHFKLNLINRMIYGNFFLLMVIKLWVQISFKMKRENTTFVVIAVKIF